MDLARNPNAMLVRPPIVCVLLNKNLHYNFMFWKNHPLDYVVPAFILQLVLSVVISHTLYFVLRPLRQPKLVFNILAGIILEPSNFLPGMRGGNAFTFQFSLVMAVSYFVVFTHALDELNLLCSELGQMSSSITMLHQCVAKQTALWIELFFRGAVSILSLLLLVFHTAKCLISFVFCCTVEHMGVLWIRMISWGISLCFVRVGEKVLMGLAVAICVASPFEFQLRNVHVGVVRDCAKRGRWVAEQLAKQELLQSVLFYLAGIDVAVRVSSVLLRSFVGQQTPYLFGSMTYASAAIIMELVIPDGPPLGDTIVRKCESILFEFFMPLFFVRIGYFTDLTT
ncbi:cation/H(+) antiporter 18-like [Hibiscus syriacus]|uniref:cation/H(+) antiporter 18-like n=1 Tax=Hibiscus syriacus TaxID=106335 RepID=UPI001921AB3B|nr:cation/H(+) antiporter 18-like [Hibiscus syriacus]